MRDPRDHRRARSVASALLALALLAQPALARVSDDTYLDRLWHLEKIRAFEAWDHSLGFEGVTIAIIDTGVDTLHPDLKDNIWRNHREVAGNGIDDDLNGYVDDVHGWDFVEDDADPRPSVNGSFTTLGVNHGTIDAAIAAAKGDNGQGVVGVSWQSSIMPLRVLRSDGYGDPRDVVHAIEYAVHNGAKIINLSFAGPVTSPELAVALRRAYDAGVFIVAASGNAPEGRAAADLDHAPLYPVCADVGQDENFVYGVTAVDVDDRLPEFANFGAGCVDLAAPGVRMLSAQYFLPGDAAFGQPYGGYYNGTSLAAAVVSGTVSLLYAIDRNLTPKQIMNVLTETAVRIDDRNPGYFGKIGRGRIDAAAAVERVLNNVRGPRDASTVATASLVPPGSTLVVAAPASKRQADVRIYTDEGLFVRSFLAFPAGFTGGVSLAAADFDGAGKGSIVAAAGPGGAPQVRIYDLNTHAIGGFLAYDGGFRGGVSVVAADVDGDGRDEIVTGAGSGGGPHVRVFTPTGLPLGGFFAFDSVRRRGVILAAGDVDRNGRDDIVVAEPGGMEVRIIDGQGTMKAKFPVVSARDLAVLDVDADGKPEIVVRTVVRGVATAVAYDAEGKRLGTFDATAALPKGAVFGALPGFAPTIVATTVSGATVGFAAFEKLFRGGVSAIRIP